MAKAEPIAGLREHEPFALAAARVVAVRARELREGAADVLDTTDIERVHDMRVATRRLRAALELFAPCFPRKRLKAALREVKALADALGQRRDPDVTIAFLRQVSRSFARADRTGVDGLIEAIETEQRAANEALAPFVAGERLAALDARLAELVSIARARGGGLPREGKRAA